MEPLDRASGHFWTALLDTVMDTWRWLLQYIGCWPYLTCLFLLHVDHTTQGELRVVAFIL